MRLFTKIGTLLFLFSIGVTPCLAQPDNITIVYAREWAPLSYGEGDNVKGYLPFLVEKLLADNLDYKVNHLGVPWERAQRMVERGEADGFVTAPTKKRLLFSESTKNYVYQVRFRAFVKADSAAHQALQKTPDLHQSVNLFRFCDVLGNGWAEEFYRNHNINYLSVPTLTNCVKMIDIGRQDITIQSSDATRYVLKKEKMEENIVELPHIYDRNSFTLLISRKSPHFGHLTKKVDQKIIELVDNGQYQEYLSEMIFSAVQ